MMEKKIHRFGNGLPMIYIRDDEIENKQLFYLETLLKDAAYIIANFIKPGTDIDLKIRYDRANAVGEKNPFTSITWSFEIEDDKTKFPGVMK